MNHPVTQAVALAGMALAFSAHAQMPEVVGLHLVSLHSESGKAAEGSRGWNNENWGIYARWSSGLTLGTYKNSLYQRSYYAGWTFKYEPFALTAGVVTGYDRVTDGAGDYSAVRCEATCRLVNLERAVVPFIAPSVRFELTAKTSARLSILAAPRQPAALHLSVERAL